VGNHLFVIFAVLDVSCAVNLCINHSFFTFINYISAVRRTTPIITVRKLMHRAARENVENSSEYILKSEMRKV